MEWASIPADLCALVISWHEASTYILGDRRDAARWQEIHVTRGVKQGCVVAPALWTLFSCYVWSQLDALAGSLWNAEHTTGYADDFHFQWELSAYKQCRQVGLDIDMIFSTLQAHGLQINPEKSHFLVEVRGSDAEKWLRKHKVRSPDGEGWMFRFNLFTKAEVPLVKSFKYLGVMLSYRFFKDETLKYRMDLAQAHRNRLAKVLQGRGGLGVDQRRRIWQVCVQTSQTYGLAAVGITEAGLKKLHIQTMKHVRALAKSPRHITRESDEELLGRLGVRRPQEVLLQQLDGMIRRHGACTGMPCFGRDALLDWLALQRASLGGLGRQCKRSTTEGAVRDLPGHGVADGMEQETADASGVVLVQLPDATPQYACQVCGQYFATLHQVKTHEGRFHQEFAPKREMSNKADYSIGGLPQCRFLQAVLLQMDGAAAPHPK